MGPSEILPYIAYATTGVLGFIVGGKRMRKVTTDTKEISNLKDIIDIEKASIEFLSARIGILEDKINLINKRCDNCIYNKGFIN